MEDYRVFFSGNQFETAIKARTLRSAKHRATGMSYAGCGNIFVCTDEGEPLSVRWAEDSCRWTRWDDDVYLGYEGV